MTDTDLVRRRFEKAFRSYDEHALVQQNISRRLFDYWQQYRPARPRRLLELGCGTGGLTRLLQTFLPTEHLYLNDLCAPSAELVGLFPPHSCTFLHGDMETLPLPDGLDAVLSASAVQWTRRPLQLAARLADALTAGGWLVLSTFVSGHYREIRALTGAGLDYPTAAQYRRTLARNCELLLCREEEQILYFPDAPAVLRHIRHTGVSGTRRTVWTKGYLKTFCDRYGQQFRDSGGLRLSYRPLYLIARKK